MKRRIAVDLLSPCAELSMWTEGGVSAGVEGFSKVGLMLMLMLESLGLGECVVVDQGDCTRSARAVMWGRELEVVIS